VPAFEYQALDQTGRQTKGVLEGDTSRQIRAQLRSMGLNPLSVDQVENKAKSSASGFSFRPRRKLNAADKALVTRQLATLIEAALPVEEALSAVSQQSSQDWIKSMMLAVRSRVVEGHTLADALGEFPGSFDYLYCAMVAAGEKSGQLGSVLVRLADYTEKQQSLRSKVTVALIYPAFLILVALGVVSFLLSYVVPMVVEQFTTLNADLPILTRIVIGLSEFIQAWGLLVLGGLIGVYMLFKYLIRIKAYRLVWHKVQLHLPIFSKVVIGLSCSRFARTLSIMVASGVPLLEGMRIASDLVSNEIIKGVISDATVRVREGASLNRSLAESGYFPPMMLHMIASGENSGELEQMLERTADHQDQDFETMVTVSLGLFEPLMILIMGILVLMIVLAILLPIFQLNQLVGV
jgi:general secretion pathway protein F